jgi:hypothetical protein
MKPTPEMLAALGITREDILNCTVKEIAKDILGQDEVGEYHNDNIETLVNRETHKFIEAKVLEIINEKCNAAMAPVIQTKLDDYLFQQTNQWGEKQGTVLTMTEFIVKKITGFMLEEVDSNGRTQAECRARSDSFYKSGPRIAMAINGYFAIAMKTAMDQILKDSASILDKGIKEAASAALGTIHQRLTAEIKVK